MRGGGRCLRVNAFRAIILLLPSSTPWPPSVAPARCLISHPVRALLETDDDEVEALTPVRQPRRQVRQGAVPDVEAVVGRS